MAGGISFSRRGGLVIAVELLAEGLGADDGTSQRRDAQHEQDHNDEPRRSQQSHRRDLGERTGQPFAHFGEPLHHHLRALQREASARDIDRGARDRRERSSVPRRRGHPERRGHRRHVVLGLRGRHAAPVDSVEHFARVLVAARCLLVEQATHDRFDRFGHVHRGILARHGRRIGRHLHAEQRDLALGLERANAGQHLEQDHAERVEIGARVDLLPERLLGRHVLRRSVHHPELGEHLPGLRRLPLAAARDAADRNLGDAEVEHLDEIGIALSLDEHDVLRLQVAVHDAERVRAREIW